MISTQVVDMRHYEPMQEPNPVAPAPARRMAGYYGSIVEAATASWLGGVEILSALRCRRRPGRRRCPGHLAFRRSDVPARIDWACNQCEDKGIISGWRDGPWDLSRHQVDGEHDPEAWVEVRIEEDAHRLLLGPPLWDPSAERVLKSARLMGRAVLLKAPRAAMEGLVDFAAAEANHARGRRAQTILDLACGELERALRDADRSTPRPRSGTRHAKARPHDPLDLPRIAQEVDSLWSDAEAWLHRETGEVYIVPEAGFEEAEDEAKLERLIESGKLIRIDREPWDDNRRAERFVAGLRDAHRAHRIAGAWRRRGRGRWHRFKTALQAAGLLDEWHDYRLGCVRADVARLLEAEGIAYRER